MTTVEKLRTDKLEKGRRANKNKDGRLHRGRVKKKTRGAGQEV